MQSKIAELLRLIPWEKWEQILEDEPEWRYMRPLSLKYPFGPFAVAMVAVGLNDYQLKGKSEEVYWPKIQTILTASEVPTSPNQLISVLRPFYKFERLNQRKASRLDRFLKSELADSLWANTTLRVAQDFEAIWMRLSIVMNQGPQDKTIVFAMKCLGISLLMAGEYGFDFSRIPIPVDSRIEALTQKVFPGQLIGRGKIQGFWSEILAELKEGLPELSMIHLDSLCWQIGTLSVAELMAYFERLELAEVGQKLIGLSKERSNS